MRRTLRVAGLPVRATGRSLQVVARDASRAVALRFGRGASMPTHEQLRHRASAATAADTREVLGELKGGALKLGQLLSTVEALFPADPDGSWREALVALQDSNPGLPWDELEPSLVHELGPDWRRRFQSFDPEPCAGASIGQVHRAVWHDGREVAVKIQYPGIAEVMAGDVRALGWALRTMSVVSPGVSMPPLVAELRTRLSDELDYLREADHQRAFAKAYAGDDRYVVPDVVLASPTVLVTEWLDGTPLAALAMRGTEAERNAAGALYQGFFLDSPPRVGLLHTDPHPGNFRLTDDGRLGVLDFGSTLPTPGGLPPTFGGLIGAMTATDPDAVEAALRAGGFVRPGAKIDVVKLIDYLAPFSEPARHDVFHYSRAWLKSEFGRVNDPRNPDFAVALQLTLPAEQLFTHRVWLGLVGMLSALEATVEVRGELIRHLPGFAEAVGEPARSAASPDRDSGL